MTAHYQVQGDIALITIDNPPVNGLGHATRVGIADGMAKALADVAVQAIIITGAGKAFSGGADIREFGSAKAMMEPNLNSVILLLEKSTKPVIAAIHSVAMGGGLELALGCHYRIAAPGASIALPEVKLGLLPGAGGTQRLPRFIGKAKAMDLILTGRMMDASEAERCGLVARVVAPDKMLDEALAAAAKIASYSQPIVMMAKETVNRAQETPLSEGARFERRVFLSMFATEDQKEGMQAFIEKRKPAFRNR